MLSEPSYSCILRPTHCKHQQFLLVLKDVVVAESTLPIKCFKTIFQFLLNCTQFKVLMYSEIQAQSIVTLKSNQTHSQHFLSNGNQILFGKFFATLLQKFLQMCCTCETLCFHPLLFSSQTSLMGFKF